MELNEQLRIVWQEREIGILSNSVPDMWYLEGLWVSDDNEAATLFESLAKKLNPRDTFVDLDKGIEVHLKSEDNFLLRAIVISLTDEHVLFVRRMYYPKDADCSDAKINSEDTAQRNNYQLLKDIILQSARNYISYILRLFRK